MKKYYIQQKYYIRKKYKSKDKRNKYFFRKIILTIPLLLISFLIKVYQLNKKYLKICLCAIGKQENLYVKEFVQHYIKLGYNKIFIYDNNDVDDERFEDIIQDEIDKGFVSIINYRGYKSPKQLSSYRDCYEKNKKTYNWLSFFDFDEYLELKPNGIKIQNFLNNERFNNCQVIKTNWVFYVNNNSLYYDKKPIKERNYTSIKPNRHIKSTVIGNLSFNYWSKATTPHSSRHKLKTCSPSGKRIDYSSAFNEPPDIKYAFLNHYHFKSFEEYCIKLKRGKPDRHNRNLIKNIKNFYQKNKNDPNKLNIMNKVFNLTLKIF